MYGIGTTQFSSKVRTSIGSVLILLCVVIVERVGWSVQLQQTTRTIQQPIEFLGMRSATLIEFPFYLLDQERTSAAEVQELKKSYAQALARLSELEGIEKENQALRAAMGDGVTRTEKRRLTAPVLSYAITAIAIGSNDGVQVGALVYISDVLVGRVTSVSKNQSQVELFSGIEVDPVLVQTESGTQGLLVGTGKRVEMTQIPIQAVLKSGERVTTVGQQGIPPGQFVGIISTTAPPATSPMQTAVIDQLHSFYTAALVEVEYQ